MTEEHPQETYKDELAELTLERYRKAKQERASRSVFHNQSVDQLIVAADQQYRSEYSSDAAAKIQEAFGYCPTSYFSATNAKVKGWSDWFLDLVLGGLDQLVTAKPTPEPALDDASRRAVRAGVERDLRQRIMERGTGMSEMLTTADGKIEPIVKEFMRREATRLKEIEQLRLVGLATKAAKRATVKMRDALVEGGFREQFTTLIHYQGLYGLAFCRFPHWKNVNMLQHGAKKGVVRKNVMMPTFRAIHPSMIYAATDADNLQDNSFVIERTKITKKELVQMASDKRYDRKVIEEILVEFGEKNRNWLESDYDPSGSSNWWQSDEQVDCLIMEGHASGHDLDSKDLKVKKHEVVSVHTVVVLGRCILTEVKKDSDRTYAVIPFQKTGPGIYDSVGIAALLADVEFEINVLRASFKANLAWSAMPPTMVNSTVFQNPGDAKNIQPNKQYEIADSYVGGSAPEPIRAMRGASSIFQLISAEIDKLIRKADDISSLPAYAFGGSQSFGRASMGEYASRLSGALRTVKTSAFHMDVALSGCFHALFNHLCETLGDEFTEGMDISCQFEGIMGLMSADVERKATMETVPLIQSGVDRGVLPQDVEKYALRNVLDQSGYPVDALGMESDLFDAATAAAGAAPAQMGAQGMIPQLDGRSGGMPQGAVASPSGASNYQG